jgi:hypothetical protein
VEISGDTVRSLDIVLAAERGASAKGDGVDLEYFVAVTGSDQSILSKRTSRYASMFRPTRGVPQ